MTDEEKLDRLRREIEKGFAAIDRGDYITIKNRDELRAFMDSVSATKRPDDKKDAN